MPARPRLRPSSLAVAAAALLALPAGSVSTASAADTPAPPRTCEALHGRDLAPAEPRLKVVRLRLVRRERGSSTGLRGTALYGCTGRLGRVRELGFSGAEILDGAAVDDSRTSLVAVGGTWVLKRARYGTRMGEDGETWTAYDVATRKHYDLWARRSEDGSQTALPAPSTAVIDAAGRSAAIFAGDADPDASDLPAGATAGVALFDVRGTRAIADSGGPEIAPRSLRIADSTVSWRHGTSTLSADLSALRGLVPAGGHPVDCGPSSSGTFRLQAARGTPCAFATATYAAYVRFVEQDEAGFVAGVPRSFRLTVPGPTAGRTVTVRGRAIPRAHGEFDVTFTSTPPGLAVRFNTLELP
jgi:hypothetical protein